MEMRNLEIGGSMTKAQMIEAIQISDSEKFDKEIEAHEHEIESLNVSLGRLNSQPDMCRTNTDESSREQ